MPKQRARIEVTGSPQCPVCNDTKKFLDNKGFKYKFIDSGSPRGERILNKAGVDAVPYIKVCSPKKGCQSSEGFSRRWLERQLN